MTGYESKRAMAQAKVEGPLHVVCQCDKCKAQPEQESCECAECGKKDGWFLYCVACIDKIKAAQPAQEPVCPACKAGVLYECVACSSNNYPPQRPWVGLTPQDLNEIFAIARTGEHAVNLAADKLKEKNT